LADIARRSAASVGASVAGVDVLPARDGNLYVLEVNAVPGWKSLAKTVNTDVGALVLEHVRSLVGRS
jgi:ribosomal protein S6--L-glutamate ligase